MSWLLAVDVFEAGITYCAPNKLSISIDGMRSMFCLEHRGSGTLHLSSVPNGTQHRNAMSHCPILINCWYRLPALQIRVCASCAVVCFSFDVSNVFIIIIIIILVVVVVAFVVFLMQCIYTYIPESTMSLDNTVLQLLCSYYSWCI
jgi:hypothetical protein